MEIESDGVMDGQHSTFENVFEMRQKVEIPSGGEVSAQCARIRVVSIFKLIRTRRGHILRSPRRMPAKPHIKNTDGWLGMHACYVNRLGHLTVKLGESRSRS